MIKYREGYKYQLAEDYLIKTPIKGNSVMEDFFILSLDGTLLIRKGYAWDGASGPTFDSKSSMRPSLIHDVFCQLMRSKKVNYTYWQKTINKLFEEQCIEDGMWKWRAALWHTAVEFADAGNPSQGPDNVVLTAP